MNGRNTALNHRADDIIARVGLSMMMLILDTQSHCSSKSELVEYYNDEE